MIPNECRLDIFIDERLQALAIVIERGFDRLPAESMCQLVCSGLALNYKNLMYAAHPQVVKSLEAKLRQIDGVYVNEYPPEIQAELDSAD